MSDPLYVERNGHRTWLKWHRGRRRASDPVFTGARLLEAMQLGASVEVDLVIHADHGCAILHNLTLDEETTGKGLVRETRASDLRQLHLRSNDGSVLPDQVMLLEDLCALLAQNPPHPDALLQLDFKEEFSAVTPEVVESFAATVAPVLDSLILSGGDLDAISVLSKASHIRSGYDPCYGQSLARLKATGDHQSFIEDALAAAPGAEMIYLAHEIILAAEEAGTNIIAPIHAANRRVDAWTIRQIDPTTLGHVERLLALKVDQITTDDPEGLKAALEP